MWQFWRPSAWADILGAYPRRARVVAGWLLPFFFALLSGLAHASMSSEMHAWYPNEGLWAWGGVSKLVCIQGAYAALVLCPFLVGVSLFSWAYAWNPQEPDLAQDLLKLLEARDQLQLGSLRELSSPSSLAAAADGLPEDNLESQSLIEPSAPCATAAQLCQRTPESILQDGHASLQEQADAALQLCPQVIGSLTQCLEQRTVRQLGRHFQGPWEMATAWRL